MPPALDRRDRLADLLWRARRSVLIRRRPLAFVCAAVAVLAGLHAATPTPVTLVPVTVAAHDLAAGRVLQPGDLRRVGFTQGSVPDHRIRGPVGRILAAPVRRGEPITDTRVVGPALTTSDSGVTTVPVRFPDPAMAGLLRVGDAIDVLAADPQGADASMVAHHCVVLALPPSGDAGSSASAGLAADGQSGRLVVLGVPSADVTAVSGAAVTHYLTYAYDR